MLKLYLIRHGETDWNADGRIQGHTDVELNARGLEQARRLAARIPEEGAFQAIYSSPLRRAYRTAELLGEQLHLPITSDARLLERSLGQLEGLTMSDILEKFPDVHRAWHEGGTRPHIPDEETREAFMQRTRDFIRDVRAQHGEGRVLAVTHGGTITMLMMTGLNLDIEHSLPFHIDNASINIIQWGERGARLRLLNDTCHLHVMRAAAMESPKQYAEQRITAAEVQ